MLRRGWGWHSALVAAYFLQRYVIYSVFRVWPHHGLDGYAPFAAAALAAVLTRAYRGGARLDFVLQYAVRFTWCAILVIYGLAKIQRGQFYPSFPSTLDSTLSELSGSDLTWAYYGRSYPYTLFIAGAELAAGALLVTRRTQLLGALLAAGIFANVACIDWAYDIGPADGVKLIATSGALAALYLLAVDAGRLVALFWHGTAQPAAPHPFGKRGRVFVLAQIGLLVLWLVPRTFASQAAVDSFLHAPTALHGIWDVVEATPATPLEVGTRIYFDDARSQGAIRARGSLQPIHYTIAPTGTIEIGLSKARFAGVFARTGTDVVRLLGRLDGTPMTLLLHRGALRH